MDNYLNGDLTAAGVKQLKENRGWFLTLGIGLVALGILAIVFGLSSTLITVTFIGIYMGIAGLIEGVKAFKVTKWSSFFLHLFLSVLYIVTGIFIALNPTINAISLTLLLALAFVVAGILRLFFAFTTNLPNKFFAIVNGILTITLGLLIWYQWPYSGLWVIGTLIGLDSIFTGWSWINLSLMADKYKKV